MRIRKPLALLMGVVTLWPIVYMVIFMAFALGAVLPATTGAQNRDFIESSFSYLFVAHAGTMLGMFGLLAFYIVHVFKNSAFKDDRRLLWAAVLFMGGPLSMPVYWWLYVWKGAGAVDSTQTPA